MNENKVCLIKNGAWFYPDKKAFNIMRQSNLSITKIHKDMYPIVEMSLRRKNISIEIKKWSDFYTSFLEKVGTNWLKKSRRKCSIGDSNLTFKTLKCKKARNDIDEVYFALKSFYQRWAWSASFSFSETENYLVLKVKAHHDIKAMPVISITEEVKDENFDMQLGQTMLRFTQVKYSSTEVPMMFLKVLKKAGSEWLESYSTKFIIGHVSDADQIISVCNFLQSKIEEEAK